MRPQRRSILAGAFAALLLAGLGAGQETPPRQTLTEEIEVREVELVVASLANQPGSLAMVARKLADAGVNIEAALPTGMEGGNVSVAFATDNPGKARQVIGERVAAGSR